MKRSCILIACVGVISGLSSPMAAQVSPENCAGVLFAAVSNGELRGDLEGCAPFLIDDAVRVLSASRSVDDPERLADALQFVWRYRHPEVFAAAVALAEDHGATPRARVLGLLTTFLLMEPPHWPSYFESHRQLFTETAPAECFLSPSLGAPWTNTPLPPTYLRQLQNLTAQLAQDASEPEMVRALARCAPLVLRARIFRVEHPDSLRAPESNDP